MMTFPLRRFGASALRRFGASALRRFGASALLISLCTGNALAGEQTPAQAEAYDVALLANSMGWTVADTEKFVEFQQGFHDLAEGVLSEYPTSFSSGVNFEDPNASAALYFKGAVPAGVAAMVSASGLSVTTHGYTGKNHIDWEDQVDAIVDHLVLEGYKSFSVAFDSIDTIDVAIGDGEPLPTLPGAIASDVSIEGYGSAVFVHEGPVRGGAWMRLNGVGMCSSAFNVVQISTGDRGIVTAGHCAGALNQVDDNGGTPRPATLEAAHDSTFGDVAWYSTSWFHPGKFWAEEDEVRQVGSEQNRFWRNDATCVYGRATNARSCDRVFRKRVASRSAGGVNRQMVATVTDSTVQGDSGANWSWVVTAQGVHSGDVRIRGSFRNIYTKTKRLPNALGVEVYIP